MDDPIIVDIRREIGASFYNGGWIKTVTGLDKSRQDGYSIQGEFVRDGLLALQHGLFLVCDIGGSRKNQTHTYTLCELRRTEPTEAGTTQRGFTVDALATSEGPSNYSRNKTGRDWAIKLWPAIDAYFARVRSESAVCAGLTEEQAEQMLAFESLSVEAQDCLATLRALPAEERTAVLRLAGEADAAT